MPKSLNTGAATMLLLSTVVSAQAQENQRAGDGAPASVGLEEVLVTAERFTTTAQKSSLSIEVFSEAELADVSRATDLTSLSPGVQVGTSGPTPQVYVRGVGEPTANSRSQGAVSFNVDGVYYGRPTQIGPAMFDVSRIELLKGPQGTLYGRNASGGAINIITNSPLLREFDGYVSAEVGNFDAKLAGAAVNLPMGESIALRLAGQFIDRDGYTSNGGQDQKTKAARVKLLWSPNDDFSLLLSTDFSHIAGEGSGVVLKDSHPDPWRDITAQPLPYPFLFGPNSAPYTAPDDRFIDSDNWGASLEATVGLGFATLTVIPAFRNQDQQYVSYTSNFRFWEGIDEDQSSLEVRLANQSDLIDWTIGGYYFDQDQGLFLAPFSSGRLAAVTFDQATEAFAAFGQATIHATHSLRFVAGVRYTDEEISGEYQQGVGGPPFVSFTPNTPITPVDPLKFDKTNYKAGVELDVAEQSMLFLTYSTGFKAGGFVQTLACGADTFEPEEVRAWTLGSRNRFADNRVQLNAEIFSWDYIDQQIAYVGVDQCGGTTFLTRNPGNATIQGANFDLTLQATSADTLKLALEYNDATYDSFVLRQQGLGAYAPAGGTLCSSAAVGSAGAFDVNCSGQRLARTPEWAGTAGYQHVFDFSNGSELTVGADMQYASERWLDFNYLPNGEADGYQVYNAQLGYRHADDRWSVTAYINNIDDEVVYTSGSSVPQLAPNGFRMYASNVMAPRTYGLRAKVSF